MTGPDGKEYLKYTPEVIDKMVYATTKIADYDKRLPALAATLTSNKILADTIVGEVLKESKVDLLNEALETIRNIDDPVLKKELEQQLLDSVDLGLRRKKFITELNEMIAAPEKFKTAIKNQITDLTSSENVPVETITIKTRLGDRDIEIGTEYFLGKVVEYDKKGRPVNRAPIVKVLGEEDGKIKIQDVKTGEITLVDPSAIEDYKLGKVSDATKKDLWINANWNTIFVHRGLKNKK